MRAELVISERIDATSPPKFRKRTVSIRSDSVTIGSFSSADIVLKGFAEPFMLEIKRDQKHWWLLNLHRTAKLTVNGSPASQEHLLGENDEIAVKGHSIVFHPETKQVKRTSPNFSFKAADDETLWTYLLEEKEFDEVLINSSSQIYVDWKGVLYFAPWRFSSDEFLIKKVLVHSNKAQISPAWVSWRLNRTLRIHAALPPAVERPHISIRKAKRNLLTLEQLEETDFGTVDEMSFIRKAIEEKQNILISGGTSTGKTVLLRSLVEKIPGDERVIVVEEEAETDWPHPHCVPIEAGRGNLRSTVIECLRMRPNRLIVSEVRGGEAFEMLQAMNTGHSGSMTTLHSNSAREALARLENLVLSSGIPLTVSAVRKMISLSVNLIVQLSRDEDGVRSIEQIVRISGIQNDTLLLSEPVGLESIGISQKIG